MSFMVNHLIGFGGRRGSTGVPSRTYIAQYSDAGAAASTFTIPSVSFGAAVTGRRIVVGYGAYVASGTPTLNSATIGGETATIAAQVNGTNIHCGIIIAQVDSGTSGSIVLNFSSNVRYIPAFVWRVVDLTTSTAHATMTDGTVTSSELTGTLNVPANGLVFALAATIDGSPTAPTWSAGVTSDGSGTVGSSVGGTGGSAAYGTAQTPLTVTSGVPGTRSCLAAASYGN